jgi:hypothetical protein
VPSAPSPASLPRARPCQSVCAFVLKANMECRLRNTRKAIKLLGYANAAMDSCVVRPGPYAVRSCAVLCTALAPAFLCVD